VTLVRNRHVGGSVKALLPKRPKRVPGGVVEER
jgi:hypothetical protein